MDPSDPHAPWEFRKFHTDMLVPGDIIVVIGKKNTGKTTALGDIAYRFRACAEVSLFQKTYRTNPAFHDIVPALFCHTKWDRKVIANIMKMQEIRNEKRLAEGRPPIYHTIICDDLACSDEFTKDPQLEELIMNARHLKITLVFTLQDALKVHPAIRNNADWVLAMRELNPNARKRLMEHFFSFENKKDFARVFDLMTDNFGVMVSHQTGRSTRLCDNYLYWRATRRLFFEDKSLPRWRMGSKKYWAFHYEHYNPNWKRKATTPNNDATEADDVIIIPR